VGTLTLDRGHPIMRVGSSKIAIFCFLRSLYLSKFIYETKIITSEYVVHKWLFIDIETDDLECLE